jgi:hypothetical protein
VLAAQRCARPSKLRPARYSEKLIDGGVSPQDRVEDLNDLSAAKHLLIKRRPAAGIQAAGSSAELRRTISTAQRGL